MSLIKHKATFFKAMNAILFEGCPGAIIWKEDSDYKMVGTEDVSVRDVLDLLTRIALFGHWPKEEVEPSQLSKGVDDGPN